jgi:RNA 3'-phosphate cyclase
MLVIDGSKGEGGGQILRTAVAMAALDQTPIKVINIRANRPKPGLSVQHVVAIKAVAELCDAETSELKVGAQKIDFFPKNIRGGEFNLEIGTAGSITLVLQACLLPALHSDRKIKLIVKGGTDVKWSPPIDYFNNVFLGLLKKMNVNIDVKVLKRGYYPEGGGIVEVNISGGQDLRSLHLPERGKVKQISGIVNITGLPSHISDRIENSAISKLSKFQKINIFKDRRETGYSKGTGITLWAETDHSVLGASTLGEHGLPAEKVGGSAADEMVRQIMGGGSVDHHAADQLVPYLGLAGGEFTVNEFSNHTKTNIWVVEQFTDKKFEVEQINDNLLKVMV